MLVSRQNVNKYSEMTIKSAHYVQTWAVHMWVLGLSVYCFILIDEGFCGKLKHNQYQSVKVHSVMGSCPLHAPQQKGSGLTGRKKNLKLRQESRNAAWVILMQRGQIWKGDSKMWGGNKVRFIRGQLMARKQDWQVSVQSDVSVHDGWKEKDLHFQIWQLSATLQPTQAQLLWLVEHAEVETQPCCSLHTHMLLSACSDSH